MSLEVFILGTGGMMPLPGRNLASVMVRREGELFLFDCGEATQIAVRRMNLKWKKISTIFISHTHADHVTGLPGILMLSSQVEREEPLTVIGPPKTKEYVEENMRILEMYINYNINVIEYTEPGIVFNGNGFKVKAMQLNHSKLCMGYSLTEDKRPGVFFPEKASALGVPKGPMWSSLQNGKEVELADGKIIKPTDVMGEMRSGKKFSFIVDTVPVKGISEFVKDSDLLICEGMFADDLEESAAEKKHLTSRQAAVIAKDANVKQMGLIHYSPRYTGKELKILLKEAQEIFPDTFLTKERQIIQLLNTD